MAKPNPVLSQSFVWNCLTLEEDCPFFSTTSPALCYYGFGLLGMYVAYILILLTDLRFHWQIDKMHQDIGSFISLITQKVQSVKRDQGRFVNTHERTERQVTRCHEGVKMIEALRNAIACDDMRQVKELMKHAEINANEDDLIAAARVDEISFISDL